MKELAGSNQYGFTLIELMVVLMVMGLILPYIAPNYILKLDERRSDVAIAETAAIAYAAANSRNINGVWPGGGACATAINQLITDGLIGGVTTTNKFNASITTSCDATTFTIVQRVDPDMSGYVAAGLPVTEVTDAATGEITSTFPLPGHEPALANLLDLAGSRVMSGNLQMGGNNITGANNVSAVGTVSGNEVTASTDVQSPRYSDSDNNAYYVDPDGNSNLNAVTSNTVTSNIVSAQEYRYQ